MADATNTRDRNAWARTRICVECGAIGSIRKDNKSETCRSCAARKRGKLGLATIRSRRLSIKCKHCNKEFFTKKADIARGTKYCSWDCRKAHTKRQRQCKSCGDTFYVARSVVEGSSNSSGNFCSRPCYEKWLCKTDRVTGRGSQWKKARDEAIRRSPFCALCGTTKRLDVHHIIPFRLTFDNSQFNLIPLCKNHHKEVEMIFLGIESDVSDNLKLTKLVLWMMLRERQDVTRMKLIEIQRKLKNEQIQSGSRIAQCVNDQALPSKYEEASTGAT